jgi:hypothetical protein
MRPTPTIADSLETERRHRMNALYCELLMLPEIFICFRNVGETHFVDGIGLDNKWCGLLDGCPNLRSETGWDINHHPLISMILI